MDHEGVGVSELVGVRDGDSEPLLDTLEVNDVDGVVEEDTSTQAPMEGFSSYPTLHSVQRPEEGEHAAQLARSTHGEHPFTGPDAVL